MRSCNKLDSRSLTLVDKSLSAIKAYSIPRSMRLMVDKPQRWAISVALLDQGDIVPGRGTTRRALAC